jgi:2-dehydropantoate 2-reductase
MKYAVIGLGAVGSIIGGLLSKNNENVILIGKKKQIEQIKKDGLKISTNQSETIIENLNISSDFASVEKVDIIFVCVKSQDTKKLFLELKDFLKEKTVIISLQNGVRNAEIINRIVKNKVLSSVVLFNALYKKPGKVNLTIKGGILLENNEKYSKKIDDLFKDTSIKITLVKNIKDYQWSKLILNLQIAVTALTGQTIKESIINRDSRKILAETMSEGVKIVEKSDIKLEKLPGLDPKKMIKRLNRLNSLFLRIGSKFLGLSENARNSMWQSLARNKKTEIDFINSEIVKLAEKNNLKAPINKKLVKYVKQAEKKDSVGNIKPEKLRKMLGF